MKSFNFTLTYRPGSKNTKPEALCCQFTTTNTGTETETIVPITCITASVPWEIESRIRQAQQNQPDSGNGPSNALFVPDCVCSDVFQWGHSTHLPCHPGMNRTLAFLHQRFWWPTMERDVREFVNCSLPVRFVLRTKPPLNPLPVCSALFLYPVAPGHT